MKKITLTLAALALAVPAVTFAADDDDASMATMPDLAAGTMLGTDEASIRTALTELGFDVRKIEKEDGRIEAYVVKGKMTAEVYVDPTTGAIVQGGDDD